VDGRGGGASLSYMAALLTWPFVSPRASLSLYGDTFIIVVQRNQLRAVCSKLYVCPKDVSRIIIPPPSRVDLQYSTVPISLPLCVGSLSFLHPFFPSALALFHLVQTKPNQQKRGTGSLRSNSKSEPYSLKERGETAGAREAGTGAGRGTSPQQG